MALVNLNVGFSLPQLALEFGIKFMETSAKANINVENVSKAKCNTELQGTTK